MHDWLRAALAEAERVFLSEQEAHQEADKELAVAAAHEQESRNRCHEAACMVDALKKFLRRCEREAKS